MGIADSSTRAAEFKKAYRKKKMDTLETQLMEAVRASKIDVVRTLLDKGVNVNYIPTRGKSPLSIAALLGNVSLMRVLMDAGKSPHKSSQQNFPQRKQGTESNWASFDDDKENQNDSLANRNCVDSDQMSTEQNNSGYYIFVHGDDGETNVCGDFNKNESLDAETPEGMDGLEWDIEVEGVEEEESDDVWSSQYRWYADILDKTGGLIEDLGLECDLDLQDYTGRCAVHYAVEYSQLDALRCLVSAGCKVDIGDIDNLTPLHLAAMRDHREIAEVLIANGANVNRKTTDKMAPLHFASVRGFVEMVSILIQGGAAVDVLDANDRTPLIMAVNRSHLEVVELLISYGAKVNIEEIHGYTPLCEAVWNKSVEIASVLLSAGAKLTQSQHLLHYAVLHRHLAMAELLLRYGSYPNLRDDHGDTPIMVAISCTHLEMIKLLLRYEASPNCTNSLNNYTPLHQALKIPEHDNTFEQILRLLCAYNVDLNHPGGGLYLTPLTTALVTRQFNHAVCLIRAGADVNKAVDKRCSWSDLEERHNLDMALAEPAPSVVHLLVAAGFEMKQFKIDYPKDFSKVGTDIYGWLIHTKFNPQRLTDMCRQNIRSQMGCKAIFLIPRLDIPQIVKKFLLYEDIYVEKYTSRFPEDEDY